MTKAYEAYFNMRLYDLTSMMEKNGQRHIFIWRSDTAFRKEAEKEISVLPI